MVITYAPRHFVQQQRVLNVVKVGSQVNINDSRLVFHNGLSYPVYRLMCCPLGPVSIRSRLEVSLEDRLQDELECSLNHTIAEARNRQNANFLAPVLGNFLLPCPHGLIRV